MLTSDKDKQAWRYRGESIYMLHVEAMHCNAFQAASCRTPECEQEVDVRTLANACVRMKGFATQLHAMSVILKCNPVHPHMRPPAMTCPAAPLRKSLQTVNWLGVLHGCQRVYTYSRYLLGTST